MQNITSTVKSEIKNLSKNYVVVLCGGTLDVARNNTSIGLSFILQFVKNTEHTYVIIIDAPHRFDLEASSCVNKGINAFSRKLNKIIKPHEHNSQLHAKGGKSYKVWPLKLKLEWFRTSQTRAKIFFLKWSLMRFKSTLIITVVNNETLPKLLFSKIAA